MIRLRPGRDQASIRDWTNQGIFRLAFEIDRMGVKVWDVLEFGQI